CERSASGRRLFGPNGTPRMLRQRGPASQHRGTRSDRARCRGTIRGGTGNNTNGHTGEQTLRKKKRMSKRKKTAPFFMSTWTKALGVLVIGALLLAAYYSHVKARKKDTVYASFGDSIAQGALAVTPKDSFGHLTAVALDKKYPHVTYLKFGMGDITT